MSLYRFHSNRKDVQIGYDKNQGYYLLIDHSREDMQRWPIFTNIGQMSEDWNLKKILNLCSRHRIKVPEGTIVALENESLKNKFLHVSNVVYKYLEDKGLITPSEKDNFFKNICQYNQSDVIDMFKGLLLKGELNQYLGNEKERFTNNLRSQTGSANIREIHNEVNSKAAPEMEMSL